MHSLYPIETETREVKSLDGVWNFLADSGGDGESRGWHRGLPAAAVPMPVPSSYNDLVTDPAIRNHVGDVWYQRDFFLPESWRDRDLFVRFGSATHHAKVWLNGMEIASHKGGYLPFAGQLNAAARLGESNRLVARISNILDWTTLPPGEVKESTGSSGEVRRVQNYFHDFYNYSGIHRSVTLVSLPRRRIENLAVSTSLRDQTGLIACRADVVGDCPRVVFVLKDEDGREVASAAGPEGILEVPEARLWQPLQAYLYTLEARILEEERVVDVYRLPVGIRTVQVRGSQFLINGKPFYFRGFGGWHEDADLRGKGFDAPTIIRDLNLLRWIGANSFRTAHYPYAEETLRLADRLGLVVIAEAPAVGLYDHRPQERFFCEQKAWKAMQNHHLETMRELVARDRNHPCIVMWSIANEPTNNDPGAGEYFAPVVAETKRLDPERPVTIVDHLEPEPNRILALSDVICINKYHGWYDHSGDLERVEELFADTLRRLRAAAGDKPILLSEHGVDTLAGSHQFPAVMFTEEYQVEWLKRVHRALDRFDGIIGEHIWVFADFATKQAIHRVNGNRKGIFTRQRQPKMAAFYLRDRWNDPAPLPHPPVSR